MANKRVVEYADSEDSEEELSQPPRKRQRVTYSDDEEDYEDYYSIKPVRQTESSVFRSKANIYEVDIEKFPDDVSPLKFIASLFALRSNAIQRGFAALKKQALWYRDRKFALR